MTLQNTFRLGALFIFLFVANSISGCSTAPDQLPEGAAQAGKPGNNQRWLCEAGIEQRWRCIDLSQAKAGADPRQTKTAVASTPVNNDIAKAPLAIDRLAVALTPIVDAKPADEFKNTIAKDLVVQLIAARSQQTIDNFLNRYPQLPLQQLTTNQNGQHWHHLILGPFATYRAAQQAIAAIGPPLSTTAWIRPLVSVK